MYLGFGFITFELEESANQVLQEHYIQFNGKQVQKKKQKNINWNFKINNESVYVFSFITKN